MKIPYTVLILVLILYGCVSTGNDGPFQPAEAPLMGMIYDTENNPVTGAEVIMDGTNTALSDINGNVILYRVTKGEHSFIIRKKGFEAVYCTLNVSSSRQVLYTALTSMETILDKLEKALTLNKTGEAALLRTQAWKIDPDNAQYRYLNTVYLVQTGNYPDALQEIKTLLKIYPANPSLLLTEVKILSSGLRENSRALEVLQSIPSSSTTDEITMLKKILLKEKNDVQ